MMPNRLLSAFVAAAAISLAASAPAAAPAGDTMSVTVRYDDLNIATPAGLARLRSRITRAANGVCGIAQAQDLRAIAYSRKCRRDALAAANAKVDLAVRARTERYAEAAMPAGHGMPDKALFR
jgi:UrcA family protein